MVDAIEELRQLPLQLGNGLYLNFTLLPASVSHKWCRPKNCLSCIRVVYAVKLLLYFSTMQNSSSEKDKQAYKMLVTRLQCFLFDLFFLGYVEDHQSGLSFSMPKGLKWNVYVEVCWAKHISCTSFLIGKGGGHLI